MQHICRHPCRQWYSGSKENEGCRANSDVMLVDRGEEMSYRVFGPAAATTAIQTGFQTASTSSGLGVHQGFMAGSSRLNTWSASPPLADGGAIYPADWLGTTSRDVNHNYPCPLTPCVGQVEKYHTGTGVLFPNSGGKWKEWQRLEKRDSQSPLVSRQTSSAIL